MTNKEIANTFQLLGNIMELHGENKFKIRSYQSAYITLRKWSEPLSDMSDEAINGIKGVGKAIASKIRELLDTGKMETLERYKAATPPGVQQMLSIKGFGPKKIKTIWKELEVETIGELLYAVNENRLVELNGFGMKTQEDLKKKLEYFQLSEGKFHYATLAKPASAILAAIQKVLPDAPASLCGAIRRKCNEVKQIELLVGTTEDLTALISPLFEASVEASEEGYQVSTSNGYPVLIRTCPPDSFGSKLFQYSAAPDFMEAFLNQHKSVDFKNLSTEQAVFNQVKLPFVAPELREQDWALELAMQNQLPQLIVDEDIKGVVHNHTTASDGLNTLREMATYTRDLGYEYLVISDHSKSAFYAGGLKPDEVLAQFAEIDELNKELAPFKIFKSIESDILNDGSLDYEPDLLAQFDLIIASVHTNLRMDKAKATQRILTAIENPHTRILGHPTGRLLLSREGYPIDYQAIIDACAEHGVAIELNANPYRLDLDWTWIPYAMEKGVLISINPDAHSTAGIHDIQYGVASARKGGLTASACLNAKGLSDFEKWVKK